MAENEKNIQEKTKALNDIFGICKGLFKDRNEIFESEVDIACKELVSEIFDEIDQLLLTKQSLENDTYEDAKDIVDKPEKYFYRDTKEKKEEMMIALGRMKLLVWLQEKTNELKSKYLNIKENKGSEDPE